MKWIDTPPVWLLAAVALAWSLGRLAPAFGFGAWAGPAGALAILCGVALMGLAALEFRRERTTIHPHETPSALITTGVYRYTRNPIYLGDTLILLGVVLLRDAVLALPLVPVFAWVIQRRFIRAEERRLEDGFGPAFEAWRARTRRWI